MSFQERVIDGMISVKLKSFLAAVPRKFSLLLLLLVIKTVLAFMGLGWGDIRWNVYEEI